MPRVFRLLWAGLCLLVITVAAQDDYRLQMPTIQDYLDVVPQLVETAPFAMDWHIIEYELSRFPDWYQQDYDAIQPIYRLLREHNVSISPDFWLASRVLMWLHTSGIDLNQQEVLDFEGVLVPVHALDFDGDGTTEWVLNLQNGDPHGVLILRRDSTGDYHAIPSPIPAGFHLDTIGDEPLTTYQVVDIGDVDGDGLPEIAVLVESGLSGNIIDSRYYVVTWQNGGLVDLGQHELALQSNGHTTTWTWQNIDGDGVVELIQTRPMRDNWRCEWQQMTTYDIGDRVYHAHEVTRQFADTPNCHLRMAEQAMETKNYSHAIVYYEQALSDTRLENTVVDYVQVRRAVAYIFNGELETGIALLQNLQTNGNRLSLWIDSLLMAYERSPTAISVCLGAYNFFIYSPYYVWHQISLDIGYTTDDILYEDEGMYIPPPANAVVAGCNAPQQISDILTETSFTASVPPHSQLSAVGLPIASEFAADFNEDGVDDWLIWIDTLFVPPLLFVSDGEVYRLSRPDVSAGYPLNDANRLYVVYLPNENDSIALLNIDYSTHYVPVHAGFGLAVEVGNCPARGYATIWQFDNVIVNPLHTVTLCERLEPTQLVDSVDSVSIIRGWAFSDTIGDYVPVTYRWDAAIRQFVLTAESQTTLDPVPTPTHPIPLPSGYGGQYLQDGQYDLIFDYHQQVIAQAQSDDDTVVLYWRYVAGLAYEALNRPDDALIEYVAVYTAAPQSTWGILARLHLERTE